ncbi:MAG: hypothetical protein II208_01280 [Alphaproteobacteria bacterium]|nr:hypothetical protein [Alphaproteobacteria bacterium]
MISQHDVWNAIDELALRQKTSPSRMAINSGLDATIFNKSKRNDIYGKPRYPSFRTVIKVLETLNMTMEEFGKICDKHHNQSKKEIKNE